MNEMTVFQNPEFGQLRTTTIDGEPWWVGKDVAVALGYAKPSDAVRKRVEDEDRGISEMETPSGTQTMTIINKSGLYSLILSSKLPSAKRFKHWVTSEVLPAIRKTGKYATLEAEEQAEFSADRLTPGDYIRAAGIVAKCNDRRLPVALKLLESAGIDVSLLMPSDESKPKRPVWYGKERVTPEEMEHLQSVLKNYSVRQAAELVGLNYGLIGFYRSGKRIPTAERYQMMIDILE